MTNVLTWQKNSIDTYTARLLNYPDPLGLDGWLGDADGRGELIEVPF